MGARLLVTPQVRSALTIGTQIGSRIYAWEDLQLDVVLDRVGVGQTVARVVALQAGNGPDAKRLRRIASKGIDIPTVKGFVPNGQPPKLRKKYRIVAPA